MIRRNEAYRAWTEAYVQAAVEDGWVPIKQRTNLSIWRKEDLEMRYEPDLDLLVIVLRSKRGGNTFSDAGGAPVGEVVRAPGPGEFYNWSVIQTNADRARIRSLVKEAAGEAVETCPLPALGASVVIWLPIQNAPYDQDLRVVIDRCETATMRAQRTIETAHRCLWNDGSDRWLVLDGAEWGDLAGEQTLLAWAQAFEVNLLSDAADSELNTSAMQTLRRKIDSVTIEEIRQYSTPVKSAKDAIE